MNETPDTDIDPETDALVSLAHKFLSQDHALFRDLALEPVRIAPGEATFSLLLPPEFADKDGAAHGGLASIVLDSIFGLTVFSALKEFKPIATINLRIDFIAKARCGERALCTATCDAAAGDVAHVTGCLMKESDGALIATGAGAFMVGTRHRSKNPRGDSRL